MDRKNKVWLIVLAVLLIAAIVAALFINGKLSESREAMAELNAQLTTEQENYAALNTLYEDVNTRLEEAQTKAADLETSLTEEQEKTADLTAQLEEAQTKVTDLETSLAEEQAKTTDLNTQLASAQEEPAADETADTETAAADANAAVGQVEELQAQNSELLARIEALEAYKRRNEFGDGEAYSASSMADVIAVEADGVTAAWNYVNETTSGNSVVIVITVDGNEVYRSEALQPGESIEGFTLSSALEPGSYEALVAEIVRDEDGSDVSTARIAVELQVG